MARQPRLHYHATSEGIACHREHLLGQADEDSRRTALFARELATLEPGVALAVLEDYERTCLSRARRGRIADTESSLADRLAAEEERLSAEAKLPWIEYARRELRAKANRS